MRDHQPVPINEFNGLWQRGGEDSCPIDHFSDLNNLVYSQNSAEVRKRFARYINTLGFTPGRIVTYTNNTSNTTFLLICDPNGGNLYSMLISPFISTPVLIFNQATMTDFGYHPFFGRAYISPSNGLTGISGALVQVYNGTYIRPAAGLPPPANSMAAVVVTGAPTPNMTLGRHYIAVAYLTDSGFITAFRPAPIFTITNPATQTVVVTDIPIGPLGTRGRIIMMTKALPTAINDPINATFYFQQTIDNNTADSIEINTPDSQLVEQANFLQDLAQKIDAGVFISAYHNRMVIGGMIRDTSVVNTLFPTMPPTLAASVAISPSVLKFSLPGDPESIDMVQGVLEIDPSHGISIVDAQGQARSVGCTAAQEYRDTFYVGKINKFYGVNDNGQEPATWSPITIDEGIGCYPYGIATVLDTGGVNIDSFFTMDKTGIYLFNGLFQKPEVTWKISDLWARIQKVFDGTAAFTNLTHFVNDSVAKKLYLSLQFTPGPPVQQVTFTDANGNPLDPGSVSQPIFFFPPLPQNTFNNVPDTILVCDYNNTQTNDAEFYKNVRWSKWVFDTTQFVPVNLVLFDNGNKISLITFNLRDQRGYLYGGTDINKEILLSPFFDTALIGDEESNVNHFGAIRMVASSVTNSVMTPSIINRDGTRVSILMGLNIPVTPGYEPTFLANIMGQRMKVRIQVPNNGTFDMGKLLIFIKPLYASLPT